MERGIFAAIAIGLAGIIVSGIIDLRNWERYAQDHSCTVVSTRQVYGYKYQQHTQTCFACQPGPLGVEVCR